MRLLRVLENGEFIKVGSSKVQKTDVRIVAATNANMFEAIKKEQFREDLYYRLSTVDIHLPPLRDRQEDIHLLFRKFASDFALKHRWSGNVRQLRNIAEQISVLEQNRLISAVTLQDYLPTSGSNLPAVIKHTKSDSDFSSEREILYKVLFDMKSDLNDLKKLTMELMKKGNVKDVKEEHQGLIQKIYGSDDNESDYEDATNDTEVLAIAEHNKTPQGIINGQDKYHFAEEIEEEETLSLHDKELELIKKSLERHSGKRKLAAEELGISERTLYRKIKQFDL